MNDRKVANAVENRKININIPSAREKEERSNSGFLPIHISLSSIVTPFGPRAFTISIISSSEVVVMAYRLEKPRCFGWCRPYILKL